MSADKKRMKVLATVNGYDIVDDKDKGYIHIEPIPSNEELEKIYTEQYYKSEKADYIDNTIEDLEWWEISYIDKYIEFEKETKKKKILDIGCGSGYFLKIGKERGWDCYGVEPSKKAAQHAKKLGIRVKNKIFNKRLYEGVKFNVIHMNNVLEHIPDPSQLLNDIRELLSDDGIICISVPNDFSPLQNILWKGLNYKPWWISPPHHINYFTPGSLSSIIEKNNFKITFKISTFPMELFLLFGDNYIDNPSLGRKMHLKRKLFDKILNKYDKDLQQSLYQIFAKLNIGREITIYARKK